VERLFAERPVERARELPDDDRLPDEDDRARVELRDVELFEPDALRELDAFVLLPLVPFREVLLEPPDVLRRRVVLAFACAIFLNLPPVRVLSNAGFPFRLSRLTRANRGETDACVDAAPSLATLHRGVVLRARQFAPPSENRWKRRKEVNDAKQGTRQSRRHTRQGPRPDQGGWRCAHR
jgi:hypothetical protein